MRAALSGLVALGLLACSGDGGGDAATEAGSEGTTGAQATGTGAAEEGSTAVDDGGGGSSSGGGDSTGDGAGQTTGCIDKTWYPDGDGDGWGDSSRSVVACEGPPGWVDVGDDCDDDEPAMNPSADELCGDGLDNDCDDKQDEWSPSNAECNGCIMTGSSDAYYVCTGMEDWATHAERCEGFGAEVASIHGSEDNDVIAGLVAQAAVAAAYIGYRYDDVRGAWAWADGSAVDFEGWGGGEPTAEMCAVISSAGDWSAVGCDGAGAVACRDVSP